MIYRRQRQQYIFAGVLGVIAVVNLLFFFVLNRPTRLEYERLQQTLKQLETEVEGYRAYYTRLETTSTQLDRFDKDKSALLMKHLVQRNTGYSQIVSTLDAITQRSGVKKTRATFNLDPMPHAGLNTVAITLPLEGSYNNIVSFIRQLEDSDTVFVITAISLEGAAQSGPQSVNVSNVGGTNTVGLDLALETYFYQ